MVAWPPFPVAAASSLSRRSPGDELIRAGVAGDWDVGDKTGAGGYGTRNDIPDQDADYDDALIARAADVVAASLRPASD